MIIRSFVVWLILMAVAIGNGITRNAAVSPRVGEHAGHIISTIALCAFIVIIALVTIRWMAPQAARDALVIGFFWVALTVAFEFFAGHYLFGNSWRKLLADYNIARGRVWSLVLLTSMFSPLLAVKLRSKKMQLLVLKK